MLALPTYVYTIDTALLYTTIIITTLWNYYYGYALNARPPKYYHNYIKRTNVKTLYIITKMAGYVPSFCMQCSNKSNIFLLANNT